VVYIFAEGFTTSLGNSIEQSDIASVPIHHFPSLTMHSHVPGNSHFVIDGQVTEGYLDSFIFPDDGGYCGEWLHWILLELNASSTNSSHLSITQQHLRTSVFT
jgi:hypothetical protein